MMHGGVAIIAERDVAKLQRARHQLALINFHLIAQITAVHSTPINAALMASRSTTDMRKMDGEIDAGG
jgi:hypothetical protein